MFASELRALVEKSKYTEIEREVAEAQKIATEKIFRIKQQKQRIEDVIEETKKACIDEAQRCLRQFELDLTPFLDGHLKLIEDPVYLGVLEFCEKEGLKFRLIDEPNDPMELLLISW
jgi:hypothetical protein